ncbi:MULTISPECIES: 3-methyl-2-oxobutanoate hydroxymethyltransferase [Neptuniibacter]|uniref:3-methyl-2-oxobutanoate hydroxymethyltransferase n=1 Tax=Neptuniibacter TaxID=459520 RepID=UPI00082C4FD1|nr:MULTISPECIES: 3-methyl-2-oxobutanoate hydroxymethyltransferase [Neptuniibacter]MDO6515225.1 3-methyl-2-oxobutanoate hydroxymethyltransferase [Neptuniibacter sp. 2_MG-2023]MDO6594992.1 3-methyl-2-oxobutanoate hydroxymethyltransferase [Neptuniibacter sp. 1_MG-2023]
MSKITLHTLSSMKKAGEKFAVLTAYDACFSHLISSAGTEVILVGDSLGMVLQGNDSTLPVTVEEMAYHTQSVARGNQGSLIMADLPFMSYSTPEQAMDSSAALMQAGANMVKLEGGAWLSDTVSMLAERGIPVCAHLGLTPQTVNKLGGYRVQGRDTESAKQMLNDAVLLQDAGASIILLECVPSLLAEEITLALDIPVIGIGAGSDTDAQVLVMHDMLGLTPGRSPKFVKNFMQNADSIEAAISLYIKEVKDGTFPAQEHGFE